MSQYTISIKSIINLNSHLAPYNDDVFADTAKKIERGREIFFNFDYAGDDEFKRLFEEKFLIKNLQENICYDDVELFLLALKNDVQTKAPLYYKRYAAISDLAESDITIGDSYKHTSRRDSTGNRSDSATSSTSGKTSSEGKTKSSQFPQDIEQSSDFDDIEYMDNGNASVNDSSSSSTNKSDSSGKSSDTDIFSEESSRTVSPFERIEQYLALQMDVITDFVNSFDNLFMGLW
jgi:hypothetical protein